MTRSLVVAAVLTAVVVGFVQQTTLVLAPVSMAVAAVIAGAVLGAMQRPREPREVLAPGAVVGVMGMVTSALLMAMRGTDVTEPRFLLSWLLVAILGLLLSAGVALLVGKFVPEAHA